MHAQNGKPLARVAVVAFVKVTATLRGLRLTVLGDFPDDEFSSFK